MRLLITGSSGTIGTGVFKELIKEGNHDVVGIDIQPNRWYGELNEKTRILDLASQNAISTLNEINDIEMILHLAANPRVYNSVINPSLAKDNILMTYNILEFARKKDINKIIFASSREVYGDRDPKEGMLKEDDVDIRRCESPYTASKISGEALVNAYAKCYDINAVIIRYSNVYGKYDTSDRLIPLYFQQAKENKPIVVYGEHKCLDFTYIDDAVKGTIKVIELFDKVEGEVFNIATGKKTCIKDVAYKIKSLLHSKSEVIIKPNRKGEITYFVADISKAQQMLGYKPSYSIDEGLKLAYEWYSSMGII